MCKNIYVWILKGGNKTKHCTMFYCVADPTYMIRAVPSNASDNVYCTLLAQSAVHGAMAGYTGFTSGLVNGRQTYIPFYVSLDMINLLKHNEVLKLC